MLRRKLWILIGQNVLVNFHISLQYLHRDTGHCLSAREILTRLLMMSSHKRLSVKTDDVTSGVVIQCNTNAVKIFNEMKEPVAGV